ncbi:uncharacterized protein LOC132543996 [Ylistrum balloti]|uniref:uncharacterized protein LOC132543996 n=1 Tax=Ylistrum balloti TaxID=509963 RepID=UPI002905B136|nr:uncharacterized protein LOC132543996 [Ylistrum balloti]
METTTIARQRIATYWWLIVCVALFYGDVTGTCDTLFLLSSNRTNMHEVIDEFVRTRGVGKTALYQAYHQNGSLSMELFYVNELRSWVMGRNTSRNKRSVLKEFETSLKPRANTLRSELRKQLNDFEQMSSQLEETKEHYIDLAKWIKPMMDPLKNTSLSEMGYNVSPELTSYRDWHNSNSIRYIINLFGSGMEFLLFYKVVTKPAMLVFSTVTFGLGIALSAYDIYDQVQQEKETLDKLKQQKSDVTKTIDIMERDIRQIENFKSKYRDEIVKPLQSLLDNYFPNQFKSFRVYLKKLNNIKNINHRFTYHMNVHLNNTINDIKMNTNETINSRNLYQNALEEINKGIAKKMTPTQIITTIHMIYNSTSLPTEFKSTFNLLRYLAVNFTSVGYCYWGISMDRIRSGEVDMDTSGPLCQSPELEDDERDILANVNKTVAPCRILRQMKGDIFDSMFKLIKFIADFILPDKDCYWGYDLVYLRNTSKTSSAFNKMELDYRVYLYLNEAMTRNLSTPSVFNGLCQIFKICDQRWQTFVYCSIRPTSEYDTDVCAQQNSLDCRNMASVYIGDVDCYG